MGMVLDRMVVGPLAENVYIVGDGDSGECIVIDPGAEGERILAEVQRLGLSVRLIVSTHGHVDHTGAVVVIKEATEAEYAINTGDVPLLENSMVSPIVGMFPDFRQPPHPDREMKDGDVIHVGRLEFKVLETPGHTPGGVCVYGQGLVFTGDTLFQGSIGRYDLPGGDGRSLLDSIFGKLVPLPEETRILPGHGEESTVGWEKEHNPFLNGRFRIKE